MSKLLREVGDIRTFNKYEGQYVIREVLDDPRMTMEWTWVDAICPNCNHRVDRTVTHNFYRIEILARQNIEDANVKEADILMLGHTLDNKLMFLTIDKIREALKQSKKFNALVKK